MEKSLKRQIDVITSGTEEILVIEELKSLIDKSISNNKPLKVKLGLDPTAPDIHLGHTVVLQKLRQFQDMGHKAVLIIGDYTARIGDPSGRSALRPKLSESEIEKNAKTYVEQAFKILIPEKTEVTKNSKWLSRLQFGDILNLTSRFTVARMLEREDFKKRYKNNMPIAIMEFLYPIMQAYDSVSIEADVELGGTDQRFNLLMGRELQKELDQKPQVAVTMPLLVGTDGIEKMSKSLGNYVGIYESPDEIFGKVMSIPDDVMIDYFRLLTRLEKDEIKKIEDDIKKGKLNPSIAKRKLAKIITGDLYSEKEAIKSEEKFDLVFKKKKVPENIKNFVIYGRDTKDYKISIIRILKDSGLVSSNSEARRMVIQGGVKIDGKKIDDPAIDLDLNNLDNKVVQKGKRHFRKIIVKG
ncbi:MAG: tyrosine--tRNA ligase [Actinomycetota bacterium]|nr:tyrosine--tRNA ligase [Actinomycetota bacterium]